MSDINNPAKGVIPASSLLLILLTVGGIILHEKPFQSSRPTEHEIERDSSPHEGGVNTPQWDDPFKDTAAELHDWEGLVEQEIKTCQASEFGLGRLRQDIADRIAVDPNTKIGLMFVLSASGYTHNAVEVRRRQRAAMAQALVSNGFAPETPGKIGVLATPLIELDEQGLKPSSSFDFYPYEWFHRQGKSILVLWAMSSYVLTDSSTPRVSIEVILNSIAGPSERASIQPNIIGPGDSSELRGMYAHRLRAASGSAPVSVQKRKREELGRQQLPRLNQAAWPVGFCAAVEPQESEATMAGPETTATEEEGYEGGLGDWQLQMPPEEATAILREAVHCENPDGVQALLKSTFEGLEDEDPDWALTLESVFYEGICAVSLDDVESQIEAWDYEDKEDEVFGAEMVKFTMDLLDSGLYYGSPEALTDFALEYLDVYPDTLGAAAIENCMPHRIISPGTSWDQREISDCLANTELKDSDPTWHDTISGYVVDRKYVVEEFSKLNDVSASRREKEFAAFVLAADAYLDMGWPVWPTAPEADSEHTATPAQVPQPWNFDQIRVYSPRATVDNQQLFGTQSGLDNLTRTIASDFEVTQGLVRELRARAIDLCNPETTIALFLEGDSIYGAKYPQTFLNAIEHCDEGTEKANLQVSYYFSHTEGDSHGSGGSGHNANPAAAIASGDLSSLEPSNARNTELPTGPHQLDYVRRLAKSLPAHNREISAIGLIGADVYDKQLIIEALRSYLPGTLIFTLDADALYAHSGFYRYNQNLLVASAYGLSGRNVRTLSQSESGDPRFENQLKSEIAFRDSYQTSFFVAARTAIKGEVLECTPKMLFEVGREGLIDITPRPVGETRYCIDNQWADEDPGQKTDWAAFAFQLPFLLGPLILLQVFLLHARRQVPLRSEVGSHGLRRHRIKQLVWFNRIALIGMIIILVFWQLNPSFEPLYLFQGISAAPTVVFRVSAIMFSLSLIIFIESRVQANSRELSNYFEMEEGKDVEAPRTRFVKRVGAWIRACSISQWEAELAGKLTRSHRTRHEGWMPPCADEIWERYTTLGRFHPRVVRILGWLLAILFAAYFIAYRVFAEPHLVRYNTFEIPGLPQILNGFDLLVLASVFFSIAAVLMAGDALRLCTVFVRYHEYDFIHWKHFPNRNIYRNLSSYAANRLASVEMIMRRSEVMHLVIIFPFIVLFLQVAARSNLFEGWTWNPGVVTIYGGFAMYLFYRTTRLQQAANRARRNILIDLKRECAKLRMTIENARSAAGDESASMPVLSTAEIRDLEKSLVSTKEVIAHISDLHRGLFKPVMDHPLFQAIAWPSTGLGLLALMQALL